MAGSYTSNEPALSPPNGNPEWNVKIDIEAARIVMQEWPTDVVITPYKLGRQLMFPGTCVERDFAGDSPVKAADGHWNRMPYDHPSWDLVSVFYPSRANLGYFAESAPGNVSVDEQGYTLFIESETGNTRILSASPEQQARIMEAFCLLASDRPLPAGSNHNPLP